MNVWGMRAIIARSCRHCKHALPAQGREVTGAPRRHQVIELPPIEAHITEYRGPAVVCPACGKTTQAPVTNSKFRSTPASFGYLPAAGAHHEPKEATWLS
jgi:hypothetical protein